MSSKVELDKVFHSQKSKVVIVAAPISAPIPRVLTVFYNREVGGFMVRSKVLYVHTVLKMDIRNE